jgi:ubiquinone/menaquinone biosynthesis C-methylase UbiE
LEFEGWMALSLQDWHARYTRQARWTQDLRRYLYPRAGIGDARRILDVGCGTGVLAAELPEYFSGMVFGLDIDRRSLQLAARHAPRSVFTLADAQAIPFPTGSFDISLCHFLLLWVADAERVVAEMVRVTRPGRAVLALAEPDYGGRIDYPKRLQVLGELQRSALQQQGAQPLMGRRLAGLFHRAGLRQVETGVLGGQWSLPPSLEELESEWQVLEADLNTTTAALQVEAANLDFERLKQIEREALRQGERVLYVPTFYAFGLVPG